MMTFKTDDRVKVLNTGGGQGRAGIGEELIIEVSSRGTIVDTKYRYTWSPERLELVKVKKMIDMVKNIRNKKEEVKMTKEKEVEVNGKKFYEVDGIQLEVGEKGSQFVPAPQYFLDHQNLLGKLAFAVKKNWPVLMIGHTGVGKTAAVRYLAYKCNKAFRRLNLNGQTTVDEFVGKIMVNNEGTYWTDGILVQAMRQGQWLLLDEINAALPEILFVLHSLLDDDRMVVLSDHKSEKVVPHPSFRLFATMNPSNDAKYTGTNILNAAFVDRFPIVLKLDYLPPTLEKKVINHWCPDVSEKVIEAMVNVAGKVREAINNEKVFGAFTLRRLISWADLFKKFGVKESARLSILNPLKKEDAKVVYDIIDSLMDVEVLEPVKKIRKQVSQGLDTKAKVRIVDISGKEKYYTKGETFAVVGTKSGTGGDKILKVVSDKNGKEVELFAKRFEKIGTIVKGSVCPVCKGNFKNEWGLAIHLGKSECRKKLKKIVTGEKELSVGDRIEVINKFAGSNLKGEKGTVRILNKKQFGVEFDEEMGGHNLDGKCKRGYGRYGNIEEVKKIEE